MAYTPELSTEASCTLRRVAWALGVPMTEAMEMVFEQLPRLLDGKKVCTGCKDRTKCHECAFNRLNRKEVME
jgi:hypothetical protein